MIREWLHASPSGAALPVPLVEMWLSVVLNLKFSCMREDRKIYRIGFAGRRGVTAERLAFFQNSLEQFPEYGPAVYDSLWRVAIDVDLEASDRTHLFLVGQLLLYRELPTSADDLHILATPLGIRPHPDRAQRVVPDLKDWGNIIKVAEEAGAYIATVNRQMGGRPPNLRMGSEKRAGAELRRLSRDLGPKEAKRRFLIHEVNEALSPCLGDADLIPPDTGNVGQYVKDADWPSDVGPIARDALTRARDRWRKTIPEV